MLRLLKTDLEDYRQHLQFERQLVPTTIHNYVAYVTRLKDFIRKDLAYTTREDIRDFLALLDKEKKTKASQSNYIIALRSFFVWLADKNRKPDIIQLSFFLLRVVKVKREKNVVVVPTPEEIAKLRATFDNFKKVMAFAPNLFARKKVLREIAAIELLISSGIRSGELRNLRLNDVELEKKTLLIRKGKGDKQRVCLFSETALQALKEYLSECKFLPEDFIFPYKQGNLINYIIKRWTRQADISPALHAHSFRHFFITQAQQQGLGIEVVAELVGHGNLDSTRHYTHFNTDFLRKKFDTCHI